MTPVSAVLITLNEEGQIARCLSSLCWADEIVVVDGQSTDRTAQISRTPRLRGPVKCVFIPAAGTALGDSEPLRWNKQAMTGFWS